MKKSKSGYYTRAMMEAEVLLAPFTEESKKAEFAEYYYEVLTEAKAYYIENNKAYKLSKAEVILNRLAKYVNNNE